jgi:serine/threonine-protein kinase
VKTGYILMEFINGENLKEFIKKNPHLLNDIFIQTIRGFNYLEQCNILHRDIRPENILVSQDGIVKIIDFGFGKKIKFEDDFDKSITLNWRFSPPNDFQNKIYNFKTEIYFVGKLFEEIIKENLIENFAFSSILNEMTNTDFNQRIKSFSLIERSILSDENIGIEFSDENKKIYQRFASGLTSIFSKIEQDSEYITDIDKIVSGLEEVYRNSILEDHVQNPNSISRCFVNGAYYFKSPEFELNVLRDFIKFINSVSIDKKRIIVNNLWQRLDSIKRYRDESDDLPF